MGVNTWDVAINVRADISSPFNYAKVSDLLCAIRFALSDAFCSVLYMYNVHTCVSRLNAYSFSSCPHVGQKMHIFHPINHTAPTNIPTCLQEEMLKSL